MGLRQLCIFSILFISLVLSGCGGEETSEQNGESTADITTTSSEPEPTTLSETETSLASEIPEDHSNCIGEFVPVKFHARDVIMRENLPGGGLLIMRDGEPLCRVFYGNFHEFRPVSLVSAAKWLSSATIMTLVDDGLLSLDRPIGEYLDYLDDAHGSITMRQLLSHTSGLPSYTECMFEHRITLDGCSREIAALPLEAEPGTTFIYSGVGYSLAGRVAEEVTGQFWNALFFERMAEPLGLQQTHYGDTYNPILSEGYVRATMDEYARFMQMIYNDGIYLGKRILSTEAIDEIFKDHSSDKNLRLYPGGPGSSAGMGIWRSLVDEEGVAHQISSPGGGGFVPWIDFERGYIAIFMIEARIEPVFQDIAEMQREIREIFDTQIDVDSGS